MPVVSRKQIQVEEEKLLLDLKAYFCWESTKEVLAATTETMAETKGSDVGEGKVICSQGTEKFLGVDRNAPASKVRIGIFMTQGAET